MIGILGSGFKVELIFFKLCDHRDYGIMTRYEKKKLRESGKYFGIANLSEYSAIPISTIKFYIRKGLLPKPLKTSNTGALYSMQHINRLKLIKKIQEEGSLSLNQIHEIINLMELQRNNLDDVIEGNNTDYKDEIIVKAITLFREKGYERTTIADIVNTANIGRGTFYKNFKNKKELFIECFKKIYRDTINEGDKEVRDETDVMAMYKKRAVAYFRSYPQWSGMLNILKALNTYDQEEFAYILEEATLLWINTTDELLQNGIRQGFFREINSILLSVMLMGCLDYVCDYIYRFKPHEDIEDIVEQGTEIILNGIKK